MVRNLRDIAFILAAVLMAGMTACHMNLSGDSPSSQYLASAITELHQDCFDTAGCATENFMEQNTANAVTVTLSGHPSVRISSTARASSLQEHIISAINAAAVHTGALPSCISRLSDYYVFGLEHIII